MSLGNIGVRMNDCLMPHMYYLLYALSLLRGFMLFFGGLEAISAKLYTHRNLDRALMYVMTKHGCP